MKLKMAKYGWSEDDLVIEDKPKFKFKPVPVTDESLDAYEKERLAGLEKLAKAGGGVKGPKWVPPKLNDDGSLADA